MKFILSTLSFFLCYATLFAQAPLKVYKAPSEKNATKSYIGDLKDGSKIDDLSWASTSSNACFPATQNSKFTGNHIFFVTEIPEYSEMDIELVPNDKNANMSLYGYQTGRTSSSMVPNLSSCVSCEADHKWDRPRAGQTQDHRRSIRFTAIRNAYRVVIAVAGAEGLMTGDFTINIKLKSRVTSNEPQEGLTVYRAPSAPNETKSYTGSLAKGVKIQDLSWASSSSNACFPATQNMKFNGKHVLYVTDIPAYSEMDITLVPTDKTKNLSLYAYMTGTTSDAMVPNLPRCITCEADHKWDRPKKNQTQDHTRTVSVNTVKNPYRVVIGVAGAEGLSDADFVIKIKTTTKANSNVSTSEQQTPKVYKAASAKGATKAYKGDLADGVIINDLSWASSSSNACFPGTQNSKFRGKHLMYVTEIPAHSKMEITIVPDDKNANMSLYAYMTGTTSDAMVPNLSGCVSCEADHKWDYPKKNQTQDHTRTVKLNAVNNPYRVVIGVAGADGLAEGSFIIKIKTE